MIERHTALLVEDDPSVVAELADVLAALGHDYVHADSLTGGQALLEQGGFCYALLDLQIKPTPDSIRSLVEAGETLFHEARARFPRRNETDKHYLQLLLMSAHEKDFDAVMRLMDEGGDAFIRKPFLEHGTRLNLRIAEALRKSGREHHANCAAMTQAAIHGGHTVTGAGPVSAAPRVLVRGARRLVIRAEWRDGKCWASVDGVDVGFSAAPFIVFCRIALARRRGDQEGWAYKMTLDEAAAASWKGMSRVHDSLLRAGIDPKTVMENDRKGSYRSLHQPDEIEIDLAALARHPHEDVRRAFSKLLQEKRA